jgi:hypothetical protein
MNTLEMNQQPEYFGYHWECRPEIGRMILISGSEKSYYDMETLNRAAQMEDTDNCMGRKEFFLFAKKELQNNPIYLKWAEWKNSNDFDDDFEVFLKNG